MAPSRDLAAISKARYGENSFNCWVGTMVANSYRLGTYRGTLQISTWTFSGIYSARQDLSPTFEYLGSPKKNLIKSLGSLHITDSEKFSWKHKNNFFPWRTECKGSTSPLCLRDVIFKLTWDFQDFVFCRMEGTSDWIGIYATFNTNNCDLRVWSQDIGIEMDFTLP